MVLHVINTSNCDTHRSIIPPEEFKDPILTSEQLVKEFEIMRFPSYWLEEKHIGVAELGTDKDETGAVRWVHVLPEHRRKRVGNSLMKHVENEAKGMRLKKLGHLRFRKSVLGQELLHQA